ncbi:PucR family transcriptional regulator [Nocardia sp. NPDC059177]|uniref:PucR family transcriptional regulator n=1 Tax=Nocardia sp. NPDC059177 TaxID=3346759 RepID=UPI0036790566
MSTEAQVTQWLEQFVHAAESRDTLDRLVGRTDARILEAVPQLATDATLVRELHASTRAHWRGFLVMLARDVFEVQVAPEAFDLARTLARRGFDLPVLLSIYRVGQRAVWTYITETLTTEIADADVRSAVLLRFWTRLSEWLDTAIESMILAFSAEREQWQRGSQARRVEIVHALLAGHPVDLDAAGTALSYPLHQPHTAYVLWVDDDVPDADVQRLLETAATTVATALGAPRPLSIGTGARALWCWVATQRGPGRPVITPGGHVHVAIGTGGAGLPGFRQSHREARAAQTIAMRRPDGPAVTHYDDVELACLAAGLAGADGMWTMVRRELGPLAGADAAAARLRETVRRYLANAGNADTAAELLGVHPNTVRYRIRQAEGLLGHPIDERRVYVELALAVIDTFGSPE